MEGIKKFLKIFFVFVLITGCQNFDDRKYDNNEKNGIIIDSHHYIYYVIQCESKYDFMLNFHIKNLMAGMNQYVISGVEIDNKTRRDFLFYVYEDVLNGTIAYEPNKQLCLYTQNNIESHVLVNFAAFYIESVRPMNFTQFKEEIERK